MNLLYPVSYMHREWCAVLGQSSLLITPLPGAKTFTNLGRTWTSQVEYCRGNGGNELLKLHRVYLRCLVGRNCCEATLPERPSGLTTGLLSFGLSVCVERLRPVNDQLRVGTGTHQAQIYEPFKVLAAVFAVLGKREEKRACRGVFIYAANRTIDV